MRKHREFYWALAVTQFLWCTIFWVGLAFFSYVFEMHSHISNFTKNKSKIYDCYSQTQIRYGNAPIKQLPSCTYKLLQSWRRISEATLCQLVVLYYFSFAILVWRGWWYLRRWMWCISFFGLWDNEDFGCYMKSFHLSKVMVQALAREDLVWWKT